jgi:hypothetical protein
LVARFAISASGRGRPPALRRQPQRNDARDADKIIERLAGRHRPGKVADNSQPHLIIFKLLEEVTREPRAQIKKIRRKARDGHNDHIGLGAIGLAQKVKRILFAGEPRPFSGNKKQVETIEVLYRHSDVTLFNRVSS